MKPELSVVIPAFNEEKNIAASLTALVHQTTRRLFEVIIVDNESSDATRAIAEQFKKKLNLTIIVQKQLGRGGARRTGFEKAAGDIVLSTDADSVVHDDWIETIMRTFDKHPDAVAVTGPCEINDLSPIRNMLMNVLQPLTMHVYRLLFGHYWLSGFNFAIKKSAYDKSGGFDPQLQALEDVDLSFKVSAVGKIVYMPVPVITSGRRFRNGIIRGSLPYFQSFIPYRFRKRRDIVIEKVD